MVESAVMSCKVSIILGLIARDAAVFDGDEVVLLGEGLACVLDGSVCWILTLKTRYRVSEAVEAHTFGEGGVSW